MKIVVFDSGLGSLSVIKAIQKKTKSDIIYLADKKNFPYGKKTKSQLYKVITETIKKISEKFNPDLIVLASNTPSAPASALPLITPSPTAKTPTAPWWRCCGRCPKKALDLGTIQPNRGTLVVATDLLCIARSSALPKPF